MKASLTASFLPSLSAIPFPLSSPLSLLSLGILHNGSWHFWLMLLPSSPSWPFYTTSCAWFFFFLFYTFFFFLFLFFSVHLRYFCLSSILSSWRSCLTGKNWLSLFPSAFYMITANFLWFLMSLVFHSVFPCISFFPFPFFVLLCFFFYPWLPSYQFSKPTKWTKTLNNSSILDKKILL